MPTDRAERMKLLEKIEIYPYAERENPKPRGYITPNGKTVVGRPAARNGLLGSPRGCDQPRASGRA